MRRAWAALAWLLLACATATASERVDALLREATSSLDLRARLLAHAASLESDARAEQGEAYALAEIGRAHV